MATIMLRPDLKTAGGEVSDIMLQGRFVGTLMLVYREQDRVAGSVQLEEESLSEEDKDEVLSFVQGYIQDFINAVQAEECDVLATYSPYEMLISTSDSEEELNFIEPDSDDELLELADEEAEVEGFELIAVSESRNRIEYQIYDSEEDFVADASMRIRGTEVTGDIVWADAPSDWLIEEVTELVVSDFDEDEIESFVINHSFGGEILETIELSQTDDDLEELSADGADLLPEDEYTVVLVRDDTDTLTYEIYEQSRGGLPIGTATVDIRYRQLAGFIDFREGGIQDDVEEIAALLMRELDKERDYDGLNLTLMVNSKPIEEIVFENEFVH